MHRGRETPARIKREIANQHAFLGKRRGIGRHRSRRHAADLGVMGARGDKEIGTDLLRSSLAEDWRHRP